MQSLRVVGLLALAFAIPVASGCGDQSSVPIAASKNPAAIDGKLPFDREAQSGGISPSSAVIPAGAQVPVGTPVMVRLQTHVSSATARVDDRFEAVMAEPLVVDGQTLLETGAPVTGRVLEAVAMSRMRSPGYLRLTLSAISLHGKPLPLRTSSSFFKGSGSIRRSKLPSTADEGRLVGAASIGKEPWLDNAVRADHGNLLPMSMPPKDVTLGPERRLTFRLIEPLPLHVFGVPPTH